MFKKILMIICTLALVMVPMLTAFADTSEGFADGSSTTVSVNGDVQPLQISVTHPITVTWNLKYVSSFIGFNGGAFTVTNNTPAPVKLTVQSFKTTGGTYQFTDVLPSHFSNWSTLTKADAEKYLALYVWAEDSNLTNVPTDGLWKTEIQSTWTDPAHFAADDTPTYMGTMSANATVNMAINGKSGQALSHAGTTAETLVLMFNLA